MRLVLFVLLGLLFASPALADLCRAIPDRGPAPKWLKHGATFSGSVRYVGDADSLCVGPTRNPNTWVEVRLSDYYGPELNEPGGRKAKRTLERLALGKKARCVAEHRSWDRVVAVCRIGIVSIGHLMKQAEREGGRGR